MSDPAGFDAWPRPEWSDAHAIALALQRLGEAQDASAANEAHDQFLWAVGDNQAGTFHPVVLATLAELGRLLREGGFWAQVAVMESLIDLGGSFIPEEGHGEHDGTDVQRALQAEIHSMRSRVAELAIGDDARSRSAAELLELIDDQVT